MSARNHPRGLTMFLGVAAVVLLGTIQLAAQEPAKAKSDETAKPTQAKKAIDSSRRVPPFFGQIGLSPDQKEEIYKIRAKHQEQIDALEKQIAVIRADMMTACESKLNESQKKSLEGRRTSAESKKVKPALSPKPAKKASD